MRGSKNMTRIDHQYEEIFREESIRSERIHWKLHWILYGIILLLSMMVYFVQGREVGKYGIFLTLWNLSYNGLISIFIVKRKYIPWNGYIMVVNNVVALSIYNFLDGYFISTLAPVTTATLLLYPVVIFLASLRMNKKLILWSTFLCVICMNGIYLFFYPTFDPAIAGNIVSADPLGQLYRTVYVILSGGLMYQVPKTLLRILKTQERLEKESLENKIIAQSDSLTGAYSRSYLEKYLENCIESAIIEHQKFALFFIDLDGFKLLNDTFGHDVGDFLLKSVVLDLNMVIRDSDLVARVGGDEFVVVVSPYTEELKESGFAERILEAICKKRTYKSQSIMVQASIGGAVFPDDASTSEQLIKCADIAMYEVKKDGKRNVKYYQSIRNRTSE